jgi:large subunit ribosomal protein L32
MPVPKRKRSRVRRDTRFANKGLKVKAIAGCLNCKDPIVPHTACKKCGFYKGIKVMATKTDRAAKRLVIRDLKNTAKQAAADAKKAQADQA